MTSPDIQVAPAKPHDRGAPRINGARIVGASPGKEFRYRIPVRGERPLRLALLGELPPGLIFNPDSQLVSGVAQREGDWKLAVVAENAHGRDERPLEIAIHPNRLSLTPLLGWTSWNACATTVSDADIRDAARLLRQTGLAEFGYSYVNIDSCWQAPRPTNADPVPSNRFFPNMPDLVSYIHRLGLKAGIYSTPMINAWGSCDARPMLPGTTGYPLDPDYFHPVFGGCGKARFEALDAAQWARWGFDYCKYDWPQCDIEHTRAISEALRATSRDFVLSITTSCNPAWQDDYRKYANSFRANGDTRDAWGHIKANLFPAEEWLRFNGPGHWYDMDMLAVGDISGITGITGILKNRLTRDEIITHIAGWAFFASPIQISCRLDNLDDLAMALLTNEELLDINQDEIGAGARLVSGSDGDIRVYERDLADGGLAVAFFNASDEAAEISCTATARKCVRDVLAQADLDVETPLRAVVPAHGARIFRLL